MTEAQLPTIEPAGTTGTGWVPLPTRPGSRPRRRAGTPPEAASVAPVARVALMLDPPHLARPFDYLVPESLAARAVPGVRVRVPFAGRTVEGFLLERLSASDFGGGLKPLRAVVGAIPVLLPEIRELVEGVAARYAGTFAEVVRFAVPPRHGQAEATVLAQQGVPPEGVASAADPSGLPDQGVASQGVADGPGPGPQSGSPGAASPDAGEAAAQTAAGGGPYGGARGGAGPGVGLGAGGAADRARLTAADPSRGQDGPGADRSPAADPSSQPVGPPVPNRASPPGSPVPAGWLAYQGAQSFFEALERGQGPRAVWLAAPGEQVAERIVELVAAVTAAGRGAIVVVPDAQALERLQAGFAAAHLAIESLSAAAGPQARYSSFLRVLTGRQRIVVGTRAAVFAPVVDCGLVVVWDDLDESLAEQQAPGWHAREVAALRATNSGAALVVGGHTVSVEAANYVERSWAGLLAQPRHLVRSRMPLVAAAGDVADVGARASRLPPEVVSAIRSGLDAGPVLVSVPRAGYLPSLRCQRCRERASCPTCGRGLSQPGRAGASADSSSHSGIATAAQGPVEPRAGAGRVGRPIVGSCTEHGALTNWHCPVCGGTQLRSAAVGAARTAEEIGRGFPGVVVLGSWAGSRIPQLRPAGARSRRAGVTPVPGRDGGSGEPVLVVATPGSEPDPGPLGYSCAIILDAAAALGRPGLRTGEVVLNGWLSVATLIRSGEIGGRVLVVGPVDSREVQALIRWDPAGYARRELAERESAGLPPAVRMAALTGPALAAAEVVADVEARLAASIPGGPATVGPGGPHLSGPGPIQQPAAGVPMRVSGPLAVRSAGEPGAASPDQVRWIVSVPLRWGPALAGALLEVQSARSARGAPVVSHRMDPRSLS